jgi:hypothetical protein
VAEERRELKARIVGAQPLICEGCGEPYIASRMSQRFCSTRCRCSSWRARPPAMF